VTVRVRVLGVADVPDVSDQVLLADMSGRVELSGRGSDTVLLVPSDPNGDPAISCPGGGCSYVFQATAAEVWEGNIDVDEPATTERPCTPEVCRLLG
jgi:hypothetical protein